jgi:hypothetical protein
MHGGAPEAYVPNGVELVPRLDGQELSAVTNPQVAEALSTAEQSGELLSVILVGLELWHRRMSIASRGTLEAPAEGPPKGVGLVLVPMRHEALNGLDQLLRRGERGVLENPARQ